MKTLVYVWVCMHFGVYVVFSVSRMVTRTNRSVPGTHVSYVSELPLCTRPRVITLFWQTPLTPAY